MATVKVLQAGYSRDISSSRQHADGTSTLVKGKHNVIVDTGIPSDRDIILRRLKEEGLRPEDIHFVVNTHGHPDHVGNNNLFQEATFIYSFGLSRGDIFTYQNLSQESPYVVDEEIRVLPTPGHSSSPNTLALDLSVIVTTPDGVVAVTGDLFGDEKDAVSIDGELTFSDNPEEQIKNRRIILEIADFIIPGHGDMFRNPSLVSRIYLDVSRLSMSFQRGVQSKEKHRFQIKPGITEL